MKIVLPDDDAGLFSGTADIERLRTLGEVVHHTDKPASDDEMVERLADAEIVLTTLCTDLKGSDLLDYMPRLKMISIMGTRPRMVDMKRANAKNAVVTITLGSSSTSCAALVDMAALLDTLREGHIAGAGFDVFELDEPLASDSPFRSLDNAVITAHSAGNTLDTRVNQLRISVYNIEAFLNGEPVNLVTGDA